MSGWNLEIGASIIRPMLPSPYWRLCFHWSATPEGAEATIMRRAPCSAAARIACTRPGLIARRASTASAAGARSISAAASGGGRDLIWVERAERGASMYWVDVYKRGLPGRLRSPIVGSEPQPLPEGRSGTRHVHRVDVQAGRAAGEGAGAEVGQHGHAECLHGGGVVAIAFQLEPHPARDLGAAGVGEAGQLGEIVDRHDAGHDRHADAERASLLDEMEIRVGVV